jgi:hypothetical protein
MGLSTAKSISTLQLTRNHISTPHPMNFPIPHHSKPYNPIVRGEIMNDIMGGMASNAAGGRECLARRDIRPGPASQPDPVTEACTDFGPGFSDA